MLLIPFLGCNAQKAIDINELIKGRSGLYLKNDEPYTGIAYAFFEDGSIQYRLDVKDGRKNGVEEKYFSNGTIESRVRWENGTYVHSTYWYPNGNRKKVIDHSKNRVDEWYENGQKRYENAGFYWLQGSGLKPTKYWSSEGQLLWEGSHDKHRLHGDWKYYNHKGQLSKKVVYDHGLKNGEWAWYDTTGAVTKTINYRNDSLTGLMKEFGPNEQLRYSATYKNGNRQGLARYYDDEGILTWELVYKNNLVFEVLKKEPGKYAVTGKCEHIEPNCGGRDRPQIYVPRKNMNIHFKREDSNTVAKPVTSVKSDAIGNYIAFLPKGQFCVVYDNKVDRSVVDRYLKKFNKPVDSTLKVTGNSNVIPGTVECYENWWKRCEQQIHIKGDQEVMTLMLYTSGRCFVSDPCERYIGPYPP